mmetsp:Transcript_79099/g.246308  ORF Transcript_79099/g.246308 Transcript_79099/m.246308 type:complete len:403 (-) Transcript_79099:17-1225(-)
MPASPAVAAAVAAAVSAAVGTSVAAPATVLLLAVLVVAVAAFVAAVAPELFGNLGLLLEVRVHEVGHVVRTDVRELADLDATANGWDDLGVLVDVPDSVLDSDRLLRCDKVQLVQDDLVREGNLLVGLVDLALLHLVIEAASDVLGVRHCDDRVQAELRRQLGVGHEGPHDGHGVGHTRGLDDDRVDLGSFVDLVEDILEARNQVPPHGAAHAPVVHDNHLLCERKLVLLEQGIVDGDLAKLVLDDGDLLLLLLLQDVVQQGGLARSEEAGEDRHWHLLLLGYAGVGPGDLHDIAVDAEFVAGDEVLANLIARVQRRCLVAQVPEHLNLHLHRRALLAAHALDQGLHLLHQLHDGEHGRHTEGVLLGIQRERDLHGGVDPAGEHQLFTRHGWAVEAGLEAKR